MCARMREWERKRLAHVCMCLYAPYTRQGGMQGAQGAEEYNRRERGTEYDPSTLLGADAETAAWY